MTSGGRTVIPLGRYELEAWDHAKNQAFTGTLTFFSIEQNLVKGTCRIENIPQGRLETDGNCEALLDEMKIDLDSAPSMDDAGILLEGEFDGADIHGIWKRDGFFTSEPLGTFHAVKK